MKDIGDKIDFNPTPAGQYPAEEFNDHNNEIQEAVERTGQTLSELKTPNQLGRAMLINGIAGQSFAVSGTANAIILKPVTGDTGLIFADDYAQLNGAIFEFFVTTPNTLTAVTVNVGQTDGTLLGVKNLKKQDGSILSIGEVVDYCRIYYNASADEFRILNDLTFYNTKIINILTVEQIGTKFDQDLIQLTTNNVEVLGSVQAENLLTDQNIGIPTDDNILELNEGEIIANATLDVFGDAYFDSLVEVNNTIRSDGGYKIDYRDATPTETEKTFISKKIEIGDWNMDTTTSVQIDPNISDVFKIRKVSVIIRQDGSTNNQFPLNYGSSGVLQGWVGSMNNIVGITLVRLTSGFFDDISKFSSTSYNRGWINIEYEA